MSAIFCEFLPFHLSALPVVVSYILVWILVADIRPVWFRVKQQIALASEAGWIGDDISSGILGLSYPSMYDGAPLFSSTLPLLTIKSAC